jgi:mannose-1-phosphate guanylyltransferase
MMAETAHSTPPEAIAAPPTVGIILAGGGGTRFWPLSTAERPKQFLNVFGERTLLQQAFDRLHGALPAGRILVITGARYEQIVREQLPELPAANIVGEPEGRDTAGAIALATAMAQSLAPGEDPVMAVITADHIISPVQRFREVLQSAVTAAAREDALFTFGVQPTYAATCYGYLEPGEAVDVVGGVAHFVLRRFREKPPREVAEQFFESGRFLWNSGMFVWRASVIRAEFDRQLPAHATFIREAQSPGALDAAREARAAFLATHFPLLPKTSIDFGLMERAAHVRTVRADFEWRDVGGWLALRELLPEDGHGNAARARVLVHDSHENTVYSEQSDETVALVGVSGLVIVRSGNRTLVAHRDRLDEIRTISSAHPAALKPREPA